MNQQLIENMLASASPDELVANSFKGFHDPGVSYINLFRSPRLTMKLYIIDLENSRAGIGQELVEPHNHSYNFQSWVLRGVLIHRLFKVCKQGGDSYTEYAFQSGLKSGDGRTGKFERVGPVRLQLLREDRFREGQSYYLPHTAVHTICVDTTCPTVLGLMQYRDEAKSSTRYFTQRDSPPDLDDPDLYQRFTKDELFDTLDRFGLREEG